MFSTNSGGTETKKDVMNGFDLDLEFQKGNTHNSNQMFTDDQSSNSSLFVCMFISRNYIVTKMKIVLLK